MAMGLHHSVDYPQSHTTLLISLKGRAPSSCPRPHGGILDQLDACVPSRCCTVQYCVWLLVGFLRKIAAKGHRALVGLLRKIAAKGHRVLHDMKKRTVFKSSTILTDKWRERITKAGGIAGGGFNVAFTKIRRRG